MTTTQSNHPGKGWHGNSEAHAAAGRKGGKIISQDREHMAALGRKGGATVSRNREHMAEIGRRGGKVSGPLSRSLTVAQVREARERLANGETIYRIAQDFGVSTTVIHLLKHGRTYQSVV